MNADIIVNGLLDVLSDHLPGPVYSFLISFLSHCLAVVQALYALTATLLAKNPGEWDAQTILPPLIALTAAYLALMSVYRTATWMLRTGFFFVKWGIVFGTLIAAAGWVMGTQQANNPALSTGSLWGVALNMMNGAATQPRPPQSGRHLPKRPRVWESFDRHRAWNQDRAEREPGELDARAIINSITEWWDQAKDMMSEPVHTESDNKAARGKTSVSR